MTQLATLPRLRELVQEYEAKVNGGQVTRENSDGTIEVIAEYAGVDAEITAFEEAVGTLKTRCQIGTHYVGGIFSKEPSIYANEAKERLREQAWWAVYDGLKIEMIAPAGDQSKFAQMVTGHCPEFTLENIRDNLGPYLTDPRQHLLRGLAEQFVKLDPAFKSHNKMKIGTDGLPKRVIMAGCDEHYVYQNNGAARLRDVINAVRAYTEQPLLEGLDMAPVMQGKVKVEGFTLKLFNNGNAHLHFADETLRAVNLALAEYYGEVLPDWQEAAKDAKKTPGTEVSKDLQFYRTPDRVADMLVKRAHPRQSYDMCDVPLKVLEPSCGDGAILDALHRFEGNCEIEALGIEVHNRRAQQARQKGHNVLTANFLEVEPNPVYDYVLMNPPFYGKHYQKHVNHARRFLRPSGTLYAILPVTAVTDHDFVVADGWGDAWNDLPVGSFSESGTNINTGIAAFGHPNVGVKEAAA